MDQNLARFKQTKMQPFKEKIQPYSFSFNVSEDTSLFYKLYT